MGLKEKSDILFEHGMDELYFLAIALVLAFGTLQTTGTLLQTEKPVVSVVSCSMHPRLQVGDVLLVKGEKYENIEEGQIIVYANREIDVTVGGEQFTLEKTKGDDWVETPAGRMKIVRLTFDSKNREPDPVGAIIKLDEDNLEIREGETLEINGKTVEVGKAQGRNIPIVHRVVGKNDEYLQTKGDNNKDQLPFEKRLKPEQIHGGVFLAIPKIGGVKVLAMDLLGFSGDAPFAIDTGSGIHLLRGCPTKA